MSAIWAFDGIEDQHHVCKSEDCMKKFYESSKEQAMKINYH